MKEVTVEYIVKDSKYPPFIKQRMSFWVDAMVNFYCPAEITSITVINEKTILKLIVLDPLNKITDELINSNISTGSPMHLIGAGVLTNVQRVE